MSADRDPNEWDASAIMAEHDAAIRAPLEQRIAELEEALAPFMLMASAYDDRDDNAPVDIVKHQSIRVRSFREARSAYLDGLSAALSAPSDAAAARDERVRADERERQFAWFMDFCNRLAAAMEKDGKPMSAASIRSEVAAAIRERGRK